ncbi:threonine ammonia-lyase [Aeromicrobium chenweiae]|uniref:L-threonine dehydratase catabolic TdcB n=1 Tax=Aeromicrobium chenweiae TaxID=2079793 RepID=A0A2S0WP40_9ACTN|nr:threonine ammonia-lyase [Aeromicrobium chenweiae]AWB93109.1 threonine ammonia-lyase [Aeromicrobium chenweiae]TGN34097.1 threonine ammonia-lyase [Aeromicrobium chenweiae]
MDLSDVRRARELLEGVTETTPMAHSRWLSSRTGQDVFLKAENLQRTGSFKIRGAYVRISRLSEEERARGVVAASAGNHAQGVALAASMLGTKATIFMPVGAALPKVAATEGYGADIEFHGTGVTEALVPAKAFAETTGAVLIHPFDHEDIIAGQGTVGLEILEQCPDVRTILVPLGGGGLAAGIALLRTERPDLRIIGVQAEDAAAYPASIAAGQPLAAPMGVTMADGIAVAQPGDIPFEILDSLLDDVITVSEESLSRALISLLERAKMLVEPAGAAAVAALLERPEAFEGPVVAVLSGGNIDALVLLDVIRHGLAAAGRFLTMRVRIGDRPGELMRLLSDLALMQVNVITVNHDRSSERLGVRQVDVDIQVATRGPQHRDEVSARLLDLGYELL